MNYFDTKYDELDTFDIDLVKFNSLELRSEEEIPNKK